MPHVPGLRSPYARIGRLVYLGRMLDKIRLHAAGRLPAEYQENLGDARPNFFDARCCRFLGIRYADLAAQVRAGLSDADVLAWIASYGAARSDDECTVWNRFMMKIGWRDDRHTALLQRIAEYGLSGRPIETFFDLFDFDEGRDPVRARAWELKPPLVIVLMGVAGSGKTTVGILLANTLGWRFNDADDFHPPANVAKMSAGHPLDDADRAPWLQAIRTHIDACLRSDESAVVTCSALKQRYRDVILVDPTRVKLVYLKGSPALLSQRMAKRTGHFMKPQMLESQLAALEEPKDALNVDITHSPEQIVAEIRQALGV